MPKANYTVLDKMARGFGRRTTDNALAADRRTASVEKQITLDLNTVDATQVFANGAVPSPGSLNNSAILPAGAIVTRVRAVCTTPFTNAGGAIAVGTYTSHVDTGVYSAAVAPNAVNSLATVTELVTSAMTAVGVTVECTAGSLPKKLAVGSADVYIIATLHTTAPSAGAVKLIIDYITG